MNNKNVKICELFIRRTRLVNKINKLDDQIEKLEKECKEMIKNNDEFGFGSDWWKQNE